MAEPSRDQKLVFKRLFVFFALFLLGLVLVMIFVPEGASEEYKYTVEMIFRIASPLAAIAASILLPLWVGDGLQQVMRLRLLDIILLLVGFVMIFIPLVSPDVGRSDWKLGFFCSFCWFVGTLALALGFFAWAARADSRMSTLKCAIASLFLAFSICELVFLCTSQAFDGRFAAPERSKHVHSGEAVVRLEPMETKVGTFPKRPDTPNGASAHSDWRFDKPLFDAKYTLNENNHRITPEASTHPTAALLIFGCSFSFGYGLEDEETWAWQLGKLLGPTWQLENYAQNGFGAQQMLGLIEEKDIVTPTAPIRQALFLAIRDQIRRNSGLFDLNSISYHLENGQLVRGAYTSESKLQILFKLPRVFNGSQFVREICRLSMHKIADIASPKLTQDYMAIIIRAAQLLREQYHTSLTVLLWPDIENLAEPLRQRGVPVLLARSLLKDWDDANRGIYEIVPHLESHPNAKAARELAQGVAAYYAKMTSTSTE